MSALDQYISQYQSYVKEGSKLFPTIKPIGTSVVPTQPVIPEAEKKAVEEIVDKVNEVTETGKTVSLFKSFIVEDFDKKVEESVIAAYNEDNPATRAYRAKDLGLITGCDNIDDAIEYQKYLESRYEAAFAYVWGQGYVDAISDLKKPGCPTCTGQYATCGGFYTIDAKAMYMGTKYYVVLRQLKAIWKQGENLKSLKDSGMDWKRKLDKTMQTLYGIGGMASELLKYK